MLNSKTMTWIIFQLETIKYQVSFFAWLKITKRSSVLSSQFSANTPAPVLFTYNVIWVILLSLFLPCSLNYYYIADHWTHFQPKHTECRTITFVHAKIPTNTFFRTTLSTSKQTLSIEHFVEHSFAEPNLLHVSLACIALSFPFVNKYMRVIIFLFHFNVFFF